MKPLSEEAPVVWPFRSRSKQCDLTLWAVKLWYARGLTRHPYPDAAVRIVVQPNTYISFLPLTNDPNLPRPITSWLNSRKFTGIFQTLDRIESILET